MVNGLQTGQDNSLPAADSVSREAAGDFNRAVNLGGGKNSPANNTFRKLDALITADNYADERLEDKQQKLESRHENQETKARAAKKPRVNRSEAGANQHDGHEVDELAAPEMLVAEEAAMPEVKEAEPVNAETERIEQATPEKTRETGPETQEAEIAESSPERKSNKWDESEKAAAPEAERPREAEARQTNPIPAALANALMQVKSAISPDRLAALTHMQVRDFSPQQTVAQQITPAIQDISLDKHLQTQQLRTAVDVRGLA